MTVPEVSTRPLLVRSRVVVALGSPLVVLFAASIARAIGNFVAKTSTAAVLGLEAFGHFTLFLSAALVVNQLADGGIARSTVQLIAGARGREGDASATARRVARISFGLASAAAVLLALGAGAWLLATGDSPRGRAVALGIAYGGVLGVLATARSIAQGFERFGLSALALAAPALAPVPFVLWLRGAGHTVTAATLAPAFMIPALLTAIAIRALHGEVHAVRAERGDAAAVLRYGGILTAAAVVESVFAQADVFVLGALRPAAEVGLYGGALAFTSIVPLISNTFNTYFGPRLTAGASTLGADEFRQLFADSVLLMAYVGFMALAGIAGVLDLLVPLLLGRDFTPSIALFPWIVPSVALLVAHVTSGALYMARGRTDLLFTIAFAIMLVIVATALVLVPRFGARGAAVAMLAGQVTSIALSWYWIRRLTGAWPPVGRLLLLAAWSVATLVLLRGVALLPLADAARFALQAFAGLVAFAAGWVLLGLHRRFTRTY